MLPDDLAPGLRVVFSGTAVGTSSAAVGGYYAGPGNEFWGTLHQVGLIPSRWDHRSAIAFWQFGIGLNPSRQGHRSELQPRVGEPVRRPGLHREDGGVPTALGRLPRQGRGEACLGCPQSREEHQPRQASMGRSNVQGLRRAEHEAIE